MTFNENTNQSEIDAMLEKFRQAQERTRAEEERLFAKLQEAIARTEAEEKAMREKFLAEVATAKAEEEQFLTRLGFKSKEEIPLINLLPDSIYSPLLQTKVPEYSFIETHRDQRDKLFIELPRLVREEFVSIQQLLREEDITPTEQALDEATKYARRGDEYLMRFALATAKMHARREGTDIIDRITAIEQEYRRNTIDPNTHEDRRQKPVFNQDIERYLRPREEPIIRKPE